MLQLCGTKEKNHLNIVGKDGTIQYVYYKITYIWDLALYRNLTLLFIIALLILKKRFKIEV